MENPQPQHLSEFSDSLLALCGSNLALYLYTDAVFVLMMRERKGPVMKPLNALPFRLICDGGEVTILVV